MLRNEYQSQLQIISNLKKQLNDLELKETEEINQLELERSLLNAEFDSESQKISKVKLRIALLKHKETRLSGFYEELQKEFQIKMNQAQSRIATLEEGLDRVMQIHDQDDQAFKLKEQLDAEKKVNINNSNFKYRLLCHEYIYCPSFLDLPFRKVRFVK